MVVLIRNLQKRVVLNIPLILQNANTLVDILRINHFDVNLVFVGKGFIKSLNLRYRRRNVTTDVLAFPYLQVRSSKTFVEKKVALTSEQELFFFLDTVEKRLIDRKIETKALYTLCDLWGGRSGPPGGHLGIFWVGMCRPGLQIGTPF